MKKVILLASLSLLAILAGCSHPQDIVDADASFAGVAARA